MKAFDGKEFEQHKSEVRERWGKTDAYKEHAERTRTYSKQKWNDLAEGMDSIMGEFGASMRNGEAPAASEVQSLVKKLQDHITDNYYHCTKEILAGLGRMYVADERFRSAIDNHGQGTAEFISEAIQIYCKK